MSCSRPFRRWVVALACAACTSPDQPNELDTFLLTTPPVLTREDSGSFTFRSNKPGARFVCRLDDQPEGPCGSPFSFFALDDGPHRFSVHSVDSDVTPDPTPATYEWTIDQTPPKVILTGTPVDPSGNPMVTFAFTADEPDSRFFCGLDGAPPSECSSPFEIRDLTHGNHSFKVLAGDLAGNRDEKGVVFTWTVDLAPPDTEPRSTPSLFSNSVFPLFVFGSPDPDAQFECRWDAKDFAPCVSPTALGDLFRGVDPGLHSFAVRARDRAGNVDQTPAELRWTIDVTPPTFAGLSQAVSTSATEVTLKWSPASDDLTPANELLYSYCITTDPEGCGQAESNRLAGRSITELVVKDIEPGKPYYFAVWATDQAGNRDGNTRVVPLEGPLPNALAQAGDGETVLMWSAVKAASSYNIYWGQKQGVTKSTGMKIAGVSSPYRHTGLANGTTYYYVVTAVTPDGETGESAEVSATPGLDPLFADQWHLENKGQEGGTAGEDLRVLPVWSAGGKGEGVLVAVVDDGMEIGHEDLTENVSSGLSFNYVTGSNDPTTDPGDPSASEHGTAVAGVIAARDSNGRGGRGVAPRSHLVAYNMLQFGSVSNEADAMTRNLKEVWISNNSWGPADADGLLHETSVLWEEAIETGLSKGRGGLGTVYIFAAGNGGDGRTGAGDFTGAVDNANYTGYLTHRGVIPVCAVGDDGKQASYSVKGANLWVCGMAWGRGGHGISTTDRSGSLGYNSSGSGDYPDLAYTKKFGGTSSAAPTVSGVVALILQANPALTWRDVKLILARTARKVDPNHPDWLVNGAGFSVSHVYGFGVPDAEEAVAAAMSWSMVGHEKTFNSAMIAPGLFLPDADPGGVSSQMVVSGSGINKIEFIRVQFTANHPSPGQLSVKLKNVTTGTTSILAEPQRCDGACSPFGGWVFATTRHLGEAADATWELNVVDSEKGGVGTFDSWSLTINGRDS